MNPQIQQKLRNEIRKYFNEKEEISFEAIAHPSSLPYLDCVVNETLRMYSVLPFFDRVCTKFDGYSLQPFSDFKIPCGMSVLIPFHALAYDEKYFEDPTKFRPERFEEEVPQGSFFPFGMGPRNCIGERLAMIMLKTAIVRILKNFCIEKCERTKKDMKIHKRAFLVYPESEIVVRIKRNEGKIE